MSIIYINPYQFGPGYDADAQAYITAVEAADGQALEAAVKDAINDFFVGCKADGIFSALKASCILAGARTLNGALVPLVGDEPTNVNGNFVAGDYNRKTGLVGDGSTKYLDSNRANNVDPQDNNHNAVYAQDVGNGAPVIGSSVAGEGINIVGTTMRSRNLTGQAGFTLAAGLIGIARNQSNSFLVYNNSNLTNVNIGSNAPDSSNVVVFRGAPVFSSSRLSFYSIGESLDLALLDARVSTLMSDLAAAIP